MGKKAKNQPEEVEKPIKEEESEQSKNKFLRKKPWTEEQDNHLIKLVEKYGPQRWSFIAKFVPGRLGKQCRERWHNHLNPAILKSEWNLYE